MAKADRISVEFFCHECATYFLVRLNSDLTCGVLIVCPECEHEHHRFIMNGEIFERGRNENKATQKIRPTKSTCSKEPLTTKMKQAEEHNKWAGRRDGAVVSNFLRERWLEKAAEERGDR